MPRYRIRYEEPASGSALSSLLLGAFAGFAVGVLVAQKSGGLKGIAAGVKRRFAELADEADSEDAAAPVAHDAHDSTFDDALEDDEGDEDEELLEEDDLEEVDELEADELEDDAVAVSADDDTALDYVLEEEVLEAFQADATLRERAIDISAVGDAVIELSGWVDSEAESHLAASVARHVPGVESVVNRLAIGNADSSDPRDESSSTVGRNGTDTVDEAREP